LLTPKVKTSIDPCHEQAMAVAGKSAQIDNGLANISIWTDELLELLDILDACRLANPG